MKKVILLLGVSYVLVVLMIFFQDRLGLMRWPVIGLIAMCSFAGLKALYHFSKDESQGAKNTRKWGYILLQFLIWAGVLGFLIEIARQIANLVK